MAKAKRLANDTDSTFLKRFKELVGETATQQEIADKIKTSRPNVGNWLNGVIPDSISLEKIARAYNVSVNWLTGVSEIKGTADTVLETIKNYTGLSEEAINYLHNSKEVFVINSILESVEFDNIVQHISYAILFKDMLKPNDNFKKDFDSIFTKTTKRPAFILLATKQGLAPFYKQQITEEVIKLFDNVVNEIITNDKEGKRSIKFED